MAAIRNLISFFGRCCCGGATKEEEDAVPEQQPSPPPPANSFSQESWSHGKASMDPWSYNGLLMTPSNGRPVFGYFNTGFFNVAVDPSGNKGEPRHGQPVFGKGRWIGTPVVAADTRKYRVVGGLGLSGLVPIWSDESLYSESTHSEDEADAGCQLSRSVSYGDLRQDPRVELRRTKSLPAVFPKDFKVGVFFY